MRLALILLLVLVLVLCSCEEACEGQDPSCQKAVELIQSAPDWNATPVPMDQVLEDLESGQ